MDIVMDLAAGVTLDRLLCALSALAEFPGEIERLFVLPGEHEPQDSNEYGVYSVGIMLSEAAVWTFLEYHTIVFIAFVLLLLE